MDATQAEFVRLVKVIGRTTARSLLDLLDAFEGEEPRTATKKVSKRQQNALESLGEAVMSQLPQSRRDEEWPEFYISQSWW